MAVHCLDNTFLNFSGLSTPASNITGINVTGNDSLFSQHQSVEDILLSVLGPKTSPFFIPVAFTYLIIFIVGVGGNMLTCIVIAKHSKMRTPTNLYLFSLAISDLLVLLLGMPLEIYDLWQNYPFPFGESGCYFKVFLFEMVCFASVLNVTALSVERYVAVVHPLKTRYIITNKHAQRVISGVWLVSLLCAVPNTSLHGLYYLYLIEGVPVPESATCTLLKPKWIYNLVVQITTIFFYFVPMTVISVLYMVIGVKLGREQRQPGGDSWKSCSSDPSWKIQMESGRRRQVTKMLSVVVLVFGICWAPFHIDRLLWSFTTQWTDHMHDVYEYVHIFSGVLFYLSSAVNPIIYNVLSSRFRERFRELMCHRREGSVSRNSSPPLCRVLKASSANLAHGSRGKLRDSARLRPSVISSGSELEDETAFM
ncbi:neuromedin-U receptor 2 [Denticeps clupeoides]|uniref:G-protein coupled receptors family 1 profile domain-containing protein n=1 Tax=Denticeps clupeoides TaxID=299321 RepID=A0AAY4EMP5_9TELE|nr:neuromedin-U receptor 2-like [Denticeps clupeoides]XP_028854453.1 neuromedin-U receptor 2-like [Denticeps clupeoides]